MTFKTHQPAPPKPSLFVYTTLLLVFTTSLTSCAPFNVDCSLDKHLLTSGHQVSVEENGLRADVVFHGLSTTVVRKSGRSVAPVQQSEGAEEDDGEVGAVGEEGDGRRGVFTAYFELVNTYKGPELMDMWDPANYRRVNVTFTPGPQGLSRCYSNSRGLLVSTPVEYIVFCKAEAMDTNNRGRQLRLMALAPWDGYTDERLWMALGWSSWSDWSSCSVSCSTGIQQRTRHCRLQSCPGFNIEQRHCNLFSCTDAVSPLTRAHIDYFHPPRERWAHVPDRPTAFRLTPNSYIWLPSINLFSKEVTSTPSNTSPQTTVSADGEKQVSGGGGSTTEGSTTIGGGAGGGGGGGGGGGLGLVFPKEFVVFVTVRVQNNSYGTIFSLRSRRRQDTYLSLEAAGADVKVIHAARNGTDVLRVPARLDDGNWHQIAVSIRDDSVVDSYVDCEWSRTDILRKGSLDIPEDSDLIIGYLFEGDLDQLTIIPDPTAVNLQCTNDVTPITDPSVKDIRLTGGAAATTTATSPVTYVRLGDNLESNTIVSEQISGNGI